MKIDLRAFSSSFIDHSSLTICGNLPPAAPKWAKEMEMKEMEMKTSHEVQVEVREKILPAVRNLSEQIVGLYRESVSPFMGLQGFHGPESDLSTAYQLLDGAKNILKDIADHFDLPVAKREGDF